MVAHAFHHNTLRQRTLSSRRARATKKIVLNTNKNSVDSFLYYQITKVNTSERKSPYVSTLVAGVLFPFSLFLFLFKFFNAFFQNIGPKITFKIG